MTTRLTGLKSQGNGVRNGGGKMVGFRSKKLMNQVRWLGPYEPKDRHADDVTIEHVIELRKRLLKAEIQRDNALAGLTQLQRRFRLLQDLVAPKDNDNGEKKEQ